MASGLILRRKRSAFSSLKQPTYILQGFFHSELGSATRPVTYADARKGSSCFGTKSEFIAFSAREYIANNAFRIPSTSFRSVQSSFTRTIGTESVRNLSTVTDKDEEKSAKQVKEASPEDCDVAVEDLSVVKAKAKSKQLKESQKDVKFVANKVRSMLLWVIQALKTIVSMSRKDWVIKLNHWKDELKTTLQHYWLGARLLWADVRISSRLLLKLTTGRTLTRRERQQLTRTTADIFRLVPFAVFIIVPFMEFLLPVFLKLFPNMLPSTFQDKMKEQEALKKKLNARMEYAKFLQETVQEMAREVQNSQSGDLKKTAKDLDEFMNKVRHGGRVSNDEILGFAKLFNNELTLDNISRPRLVNMCKYMGIGPYGTDAYLRYMLRKRLQKIKDDDKMIQAEGVESLSEDELRQACRDRGLLGLLTVDEMRQQIRDWLDLSLNHSVPSSLLILSRAFSVSGKVKPEEAVQATLSSLPDEVVDTVGVTALPSEDPVAEKRRKLEFLEMQEELIKEEEAKESAEQARMKESVERQKDIALEEMVISTAAEAKEQPYKEEQLSELSRALAVLASTSSVSKEREDFLRLVNKEIELYNSLVEKEGTDSEEEAKKAYKAARTDTDHAAEMAIGHKISSPLIEKVDAMIQKLEKEIDDVDAKIGDRWRLLDRDHDGKVTPEEIASAATYLKDTLGTEGIQELISNLSKDRDGKINVEDIIKLGTHKEETEEGRI
ncbi:LETM1 and EF-hand domain-containing protein 1, mitochondrial-like protein [Tanacetum coccineum]|uniref:Mitochondrial proton/calcium exchanger protein n=1 Tax=Tanacetum coccineum TaxID=301880 RepID=A0ABQ5H1T9_9ASTR